jgi:hypothetical protein
MARSQNNWTVLTETSRMLHQWVIPTERGDVILPLRRGTAGFLLCHFALWFDEHIEVLFGRGDDFGWAYRRIAGSTEWSNHASGTAVDLNSSSHPSGSLTFTISDVDAIHQRLKRAYPVIRWGGDFRTTIDQMHYELASTREAAIPIAQALVDTSRGQRLLEANPTQAAYVVAA